MDFPVPPPSPFARDEAAGSWRRAAVIAGAIAAVELVVLLVIVLAFIAKPFAEDAASSAAAKAANTEVPAAVLRPRPETPVIVLNGNGVGGAAETAAKRVRKLAYPIVSIGNASRRDVARTVVMYREGARAAGVRLARDLGLGPRRAVPLDGMRPKDLAGAQVALVLGRG